jgi:hypothetical protein
VQIKPINGRKKCCSKIVKLLHCISIGQKKLPLHLKGSETSSSWIGGIITLILGLIILNYALVVLVEIFDRKTFTVKES